MHDAARNLLNPSRRSEVAPFIVMDVMAAAARIEAAGGRVVHMEVGQPAAAAPGGGGAGPSPGRAAGAGGGGGARRAAMAALQKGDIGYTNALGVPSLRRRIAQHYRDAYGVDLSPERIAVTTGSSAGFILAFLAMLDPGDRVAVAEPGYPPYRHILTALGCEPVPIAISERTRHALTMECVLEAHRSKPLKAILVASPANPTGTMLTREALGELIAGCEAEGIRFISDEIYHGLDYSFAAETAVRLSERAIAINSFSKYFCMTGWRIGWMVLPEALVRTVERLQQNFAISVPTLSQVAAEAAFDGREEMEVVKRGYEENRRLLLQGLPQAGLERFLPVDGAFYLYADISRFSNDSLDFAKRMLTEAGVAATPGIDFDPVNGHKFLRFCYAGSTADMREAVERIGNWLNRR